MLSSLALVSLLALSVPGGFDLNTATLQELEALEGLTDEQAQALYEHILVTGGLESIYQVTEVPGIGVDEMAWLADRCVVVPPPEGRVSQQVLEVMEKLATEDGPGDAAVDVWEDYLVRPLPINTATMWDLRGLDRVSLVDAAAVERRLGTLGPVSSVRSLRSSDGLTYYGYRNMRDYVSTRDLDLSSLEPFGGYRVVVDGGASRGTEEEGIEGALSDLRSALQDIETGDRGYTPADSAAWHERISDERGQLAEAVGVTGWTHRLRVGFGDRFRGGVRLSRGHNSTAGYGLLAGADLGDVGQRFDVAKAYASVAHTGPVHQFVLGNYHVSLAQGLMMDNTDEMMYRWTSRTWGLHPDLTATRQFALTGAAMEVRTGPFLGYGFFSYSPRDAITSLDGTPAVLVMSPYRTGAYANALDETTVGGYGYFDLGGLLPYGTAVGAGYLDVSYSDSLVPDVSVMDIPDDSHIWDCPEYDNLQAGNHLGVASVSAQTVLDNMSLETEVALQDGEQLAAIARARWVNNWFYLLGIWRHYDVGFTNPYSRGFSEQSRFDDTVFEKPYYLNDPLSAQLAEWPTPKPEEGVYVESRFQLSRTVTFTKVYLDLWRSLPYGFDNWRFQGEVEYRPVWPVRLRLKYKYQDKTKMHEVIPTNSRTQEWTLRSFFLPTGSDYFNVILRYGLVRLTPNPLYDDDRLMEGGYLSASWEHNFSENLSVLGGTTLWTTNGMSQWEFEDTGIDFLDGRGTKFYVTVKNNLSDNLQLRFRILRKDTFYPRTGLYRPDPEDQFHYEGDPEGNVSDFTDHVTSYGIRCQLDFRW